jgi:hypothetical protein
MCFPHAAGGETACGNLCCLCRRHHRLKAQALGWRFTMTPDGVHTVTAPSGITRVTRPPGLHQLADWSVLPPDEDQPPF